MIHKKISCQLCWNTRKSRIVNSKSADDLADDLDQLGRIKGFDQLAGGAGSAAGLLHLIARFGSQDQDRRCLELRVLAQLLRQRDAVHARHVLVGQDEIEVLGARLFPRVLAVHRLDDVEPGVLQREQDHLPHRSGVVDSENRIHAHSKGYKVVWPQ